MRKNNNPLDYRLGSVRYAYPFRTPAVNIKQNKPGSIVRVIVNDGFRIMPAENNKGATRRVVRCDRRTYWGNPYKLSDSLSREFSIVKYFNEHFINNRELHIRLKDELYGNALGCWCAPNYCHCDILAAGADTIASGIDPDSLSRIINPNLVFLNLDGYARWIGTAGTALDYVMYEGADLYGVVYCLLYNAVVMRIVAEHDE